MSDQQLERRTVYGRRPVEELLESNLPVEKVFILQSIKGEFEIQIRSACNKKHIPLVRTQNEQLNRLSGGKNHQGILAISSAIQFCDLDMIVPHIFESHQTPFIVILDHITDVRNFGAIARSAEIFGVHALVIPKKGSAGITDEGIKASSGALFKIPVCRISNLQEAIEYLQDSGLMVLASDSSAQNPLDLMQFHLPTAIILGAEGKGIQKDLLHSVNDSFCIQQVGEISSLNVSVAAGIIFHEVQRKRGFGME